MGHKPFHELRRSFHFARKTVPLSCSRAEELNLEEKLLAWLDQHSLIQILDWFRCVDYVATTGNDSASKWTTETTKRNQLFLKLLGVS